MTDCTEFKGYKPYLDTTAYKIHADKIAKRQNIHTYEVKDLVDGSIDKDIIINADDKETINAEAEETKKILNEEREEKREMLIRQSRVLYPEKENWIIEMAVDAYILQEEKGIDILKYKFKDVECEA
jgi:uncharacterized membrane-anchored protein